MSLVTAMFHVLLVVLAISGLDKLLRPENASDAMLAAGLIPGPKRLANTYGRACARALGAVEIGLALVGTNLTLWPVIGVGVMFGAFNLFVHRLKSVDSDAGCGCFGTSTTPPGSAHTVFNWGAVAVCTALGFGLALGQPAVNVVATTGAPAFGIYVVMLAIGAAMFLQGPALLTEISAAVAGDDVGHNHNDHAFSITSELLSPPDSATGRRNRR